MSLIAKYQTQTCVAVYELRRRGYNVEAIGWEETNPCDMLSQDYAKIWNDTVTGDSISLVSGWDNAIVTKEYDCIISRELSYNHNHDPHNGRFTTSDGT